MGEKSHSLLDCFSDLRDPRRSNRHKPHQFNDIICIAICAVIAGADDWPKIEVFGRARVDWFKGFLALPEGIPSHDTFQRVFGALSPLAFQRCFLRWVTALAGKLQDKHFAIDGKTLRGSGNSVSGLGPLHLVSVWATQVNLSFGQVAVDDKSNEITAIPKLLALLDLHGAFVTIDAMGCQKEIARTIVASGGDYAFTVKGNQENLETDILESFLDAEEKNYEGVRHDEYVTEESGHGRHEKRQYTVIYDLDKIRDKEKWEKLTVIGRCYCERTVGDKTSYELRLFIGSRLAGAKFYGDSLRNHWRVENCQHWQLDVTFSEDHSRIRNRNSAQNFALLRKMALCLLKRHPGKESMATKRYKAALETSFLEELLKG